MDPLRSGQQRPSSILETKTQKEANKKCTDMKQKLVSLKPAFSLDC